MSMMKTFKKSRDVNEKTIYLLSHLEYTPEEVKIISNENF
jgi:hypothetical protein